MNELVLENNTNPLDKFKKLPLSSKKATIYVINEYDESKQMQTIKNSKGDIKFSIKKLITNSNIYLNEQSHQESH